MNTVAEHVIDKYFGVQNGEIVVGNTPLKKLLERIDTPFYAYDLQTIHRKIESLRNAFPNSDFYYSVKANPALPILKYIVDNSVGLEVASPGELALAVQSGCESSKIIYAGHAKTQEEISKAAQQKVGLLNIESLEEIDDVIAVSKEYDTDIHLSLRVNPGRIEGVNVKYGGGIPSQFGIDEEKLPVIIQRLKQQSGVKLDGLNIYVGTQITEYEKLLNIFSYFIDYVKKISSDFIKDIPMQVNFGGGFGIRYYENEKELDVISLGEGFMQNLKEKANHRTIGRIIFEPGRYLVGESGIYIAKVVRIKESREKKYIIIDGGMHHNFLASGNLGMVLKKNHPLAVLNKLDKEPVQEYDIVGPLCTPMDTMGRNVQLPRVEVGDFIGFFQSGAYTKTLSPSRFLSRKDAGELFVNGDRVFTLEGLEVKDSFMS